MLTVHDLKDLAMIYHDCDDYKVIVWDHVNQKRYKLIFTGSNNVEKSIHFNLKEDAMSAEEQHRINLLNKSVFLSREISILQKELEKTKEEYENQENIR